MIITRAVVAEKLLAYLNGQISLAQLVDWAENTYVDDELQPEADIDRLDEIIGYLAAADTEHFPLTWEKCRTFLEHLGVNVAVNPR